MIEISWTECVFESWRTRNHLFI